jgi:hypothetical protein
MTIEQGEGHNLLLHLGVEVKRSLEFASLELPFRFAVKELRFINRLYKWTRERGPDVIDALTPCCMSGDFAALTASLRIHGYGAVRLGGKDGECVLVLDHGDLHPRLHYQKGNLVHRDEQVHSCGAQFEALFSVILSPTNPELPGPVTWRYPSGALACLAITDHADWDTVESLDVLYHGDGGISSGRLKTTKSVFFLTKGFFAPDKTFRPGGLDDPAFRAVADKMHDDCHEICPHSIVPSPGSTPVSIATLRRALEMFRRRYTAATWIDHGTYGHLFNYSRHGWNKESEWHIVDILREFEFTSLWSSSDTSSYPVRNLNQLSEPDGPTAYLAELSKNLLSGDAWGVLTSLRFLLTCRLSHETQWELSRALGLIKVALLHSNGLRTRAQHLRHLPRAVLQVCLSNVRPALAREANLFPVLYSEAGRALTQSAPSDLILFSTQLTNNFTAAFSNLDKLIRERGIHLSHTYLCNTLPYTTNTLRYDGTRWRVSKEFRQILEKLDSHIESADLWNPVMRDAARWFSTWSKIRIEQTGDRQAIIVNPTRQSLRDLTLLFPSDVTDVHASGVDTRMLRADPMLWNVNIGPNSRVQVSW